MRRALNENPMVQIAVLAVLAVVVAFLLMTRVNKSESTDTSASSSTAAGASATPTPTDGSTSTTADSAVGTTPPATSSEVAPSAPVSPSADTTVPPGGVAGSAAVGKFVVGPGLPAPVVKAYAADKTVVLLVVRRRGIDDDRLRQDVEGLRGRKDLAVFVTNAGRIARYSRITQGVSVNRVPALIVLQPRHLTHGTPTASVSYGFRGQDSIDQAIRNALYKGPTNLPYYPR